MSEADQKKLDAAKDLLNAFAEGTGLSEGKGDSVNRYLWTDALAVQSFFALSHVTNDPIYRTMALKIIDLVHFHLGRFHPEDSRQGWISGLPDDEGKQHPTAGGLRIGKKFPERKPEEHFNQQLEWVRDGQYFHYLSRWITSLIQAEKETGDKKFLTWAAELLIASGKFIVKENGKIYMYWKMSTDLSRPLFKSMGAHDPLEGLLCAAAIKEKLPEEFSEIDYLLLDFQELCSGQSWITNDSLGIGGLLLAAAKVANLNSEENLPKNSTPSHLLETGLISLKRFERFQSLDAAANQRLAFRECGLSLGLRTIFQIKEKISDKNIFSEYSGIAEKIENFWANPKNQRSPTWTDHLNINAVSLAASLLATFSSKSFTGH